MSACEYYGNTGSNTVAGYCQNEATHDYGRVVRGAGLPYSGVQYACDEHAPKLNFYRWCKQNGHDHEWMRPAVTA